MRLRTTATVLVLVVGLMAFMLLRDAGNDSKTMPLVAQHAALEQAAPVLLGAPRETQSAMRAEVADPQAPALSALPAPSARHVEGLVTLWDGRQTAGLDVFVVPVDEPVPPRAKGRVWAFDAVVPADRKARTDERGHYSLSPMLQLGEWVVVLRVSDRYELRSSPFSSSDDGLVQRDFDVPMPAVVRVRLETRGGDRAFVQQLDVVDEFVWYSLPDNTANEENEGQEVAEQLVAHVAPGPLRLVVWPRGGPTVESEIALAPGEQRDLVLTVPDDGRIRGRIVDPLHRERWDASLIWQGERTVRGEASEAGEFSLSGTGLGKGKLVVWVDFIEGGHTTVEMNDLEPDGPEVEVVLRATPRIVARLHGPASDASVRIGLLSAGLTSMGRGTGAHFAEHGVELVPNVGEPALVALWTDGFAPTIVEVPALAPGEERDLGPLVLGKGRDVEGRVRTAGGAPVTGADIRVAEKWSDAQTSTDAEGRFVLRHLPSRPLRLRILAPGFPQHLVTVADHVRDRLDVLLTPGGTVEGEVLRADGSPATGSWVTVLPAAEDPYDREYDNSRIAGSVGEDGRFALRLSTGPHRIHAHDLERRKGASRIEVQEGAITECRLVVE